MSTSSSAAAAAAASTGASSRSPLYDMNARTIKGKDIKFGELIEGKVALIVNTASQCGFTPQYEGLEKLYLKYKDRGFTVIGFPCNQFGGQEPGSEAEIESFCTTRFKVTFPMMAKVDVSGDKASPIFTYLGTKKPGTMYRVAPYWNFTFFLVDKSGEAIERFAPTSTAAAVEPYLEKLL